METVYFVLGIVTVLLVLGVVVIVRVGTLVKELKEDLRNLERGTEYGMNDIHRIIVKTQEGLHQRMDDENRELQSQLDSRLDRFANTLTTKK